MDNQEPTTASRYTWKERALVAVPLFLLVVGGLVACGGGSTSPNVTASSTEEMKTAQAVSGSSTAVVPPGWTGRAPKMEVINGITVPPEPAPSINNATLAGVDVNNNGVRDDVERVMAKSISSGGEFSRALMITKAYMPIFQMGITTTQQEALAIKKGIICAENNAGGLPKSVNAGGENDIQDLLFNNPQRRAKQNQLSVALEGVDFEEGTCD